MEESNRDKKDGNIKHQIEEKIMISSILGDEKDSKCMVWKSKVINNVVDALQFATTAVDLDTPETARQAIPYYRQATQKLDDALKLLPSSMAEESGLIEKKIKYVKRIQVLKEITLPRRPKQARMPFSPDASLTGQQNFKGETTPNLTIRTASSLDMSHLGPAPAQVLRRPYWQMRAIAKTVSTGEFLSPRLHVPKEVWCQVGVKLNGLTHKVVAMENVKYMLEQLSSLPDLANLKSEKEGKRILEALRRFHNFANSIQNDLHKPFPFIEEVEGEELFEEKTEDHHILSNIGNFLKLNRVENFVSNIGRKASTAYERIGASITERVKDGDLQYYSQQIYEVCLKSQVLDGWTIACLEHAKKETEDPLQERQKKEFINLHNQELLLHLNHIASFFKVVICELIIRDLELLLERYLRKTRKSVVRMYWDEDDDL